MSFELIKSFTLLPVEVVHIICLFTGKFIFDKTGKIKSVVDLRDFENIKKHLYIFSYFHKYRRDYTKNRTTFIKYLHKEIYKGHVMNEEERIKEEIIQYKNVDFERHPLLFMKEHRINEVMVPLENGIFCNGCIHKLSSLEMQLRRYFMNAGFSYDEDFDIIWSYNSPISVNLCCKKCYNINSVVSLLPDTEDEKEQKNKKKKMAKIYDYITPFYISNADFYINLFFIN